jgi:hypothetical protein
VVPKSDELRRKILEEAHSSRLFIHSGSNKMYHDLSHLYWWSNMKQDITKYIAEYDICGRGEGGPYAYAWFSAAIAYPGLKMGGNFHGFYYMIAQHSKRA